jgi:hypothetical protein
MNRVLRASLAAGCVVVCVTALAGCAGGASAPSLSPGASTPAAATPYVKSAEQALDIALDSAYRSRMLLRSDPIQVSVEKLLYGEAARRDEGLNLGLQIRPDDYTCPPGAECPYPGEPAGEVGYFITIQGEFLVNSDSGKPRRSGIAMTWVGEAGGMTTGFRALVNGVPTEE